MASTISHHPEETFELGKRFGSTLAAGSVVALCGDLGAGKTQFTKGIAAALGVDDAITSPTFTLIHEYPEGRLPLYHIDLYRLESEDDALSTGLEDYLAPDGVTVIEWADKFPDLLPAHTRYVSLRPLEGDEREITIL